MEDAQVITMVRSGNIDAFAEIVERYQSPIAGYLYRLTGEYEVALDLTQDTFIQAFKSIFKLKESILFKSWLYGIATNKALQYRRHKKIITFIPLENLKTDLSGGNNPVKVNDEKIMIETTLLKIPEEQRICMLLHFIEGFKYREIAQTLGISEDAVRMRVTRGSQEFRRQYMSAGGAG